MSEEAKYEPKIVYVSINEDGEPLLMKAEPTTDDLQMVCDGVLSIIRFVPFSPEAQEVAGRGGRVEHLEASYNEPEDDPEAEGTYDQDWIELR